MKFFWWVFQNALQTAEEQLHYLRCPLVTLKNKKGAGLYTK
jgi:hypothetical protein